MKFNCALRSKDVALTWICTIQYNLKLHRFSKPCEKGETLPILNSAIPNSNCGLTDMLLPFPG